MDITVAIASLMFSVLFSIVSLIGGESGYGLGKAYRRLLSIMGIGGLLFPAAMAIGALRKGLAIHERVFLWILVVFSFALIWIVRSVAAGRLRKEIDKAIGERLKGQRTEKDS